MEKRLILAIILSILVLVAFQFIFEPLGKEKGKLQEFVREKERNNKKVEQEVVSEHLKSSLEREEGTIFRLETDKLYLEFTNRGGQLSEVYLKDYYKTEDEKLPLSLFKVTKSQPGIGKLVFGEENLEKTRIWKAKVGDNNISFILPLKQNFKIEKKFTITSPYSLMVSVSAINKRSAAQEWEYSIFGTSNIYRSGRLDERYSSVVVSYNEKKLDKISLSKVKKGITEEPGNFDWVAEKNRYFSIIFAPEEKMLSTLFYRGPDNFVAAGGKSFPTVVGGNSTKEHIYQLYLGPNDMEKLENFKSGCKKLVDFGIWTPISILLLNILKFINLLVHNYGISIMGLTLIINLVLFPLTRKSFTSMKKMQDLQPKINKLREEYKDNREKLNKELMNLYRKQGGNPLGGCFPMLLQFPIFISLYLALTKSIELKGANFLWISDLAAPDAAFKLPFSFPFIGDKINVLPILMLIAMVIQQRISQKRTSVQVGSQRQLGIIMPIVFGFIFYHFPSGLVLYWLTNTIIMSLVQWKMLAGGSEESIGS